MSESNLNLHFPQPFCMYACVHILNIVCGRRESQNNLHFEKVNLTLSKTFYYLNKKTRIFFITSFHDAKTAQISSTLFLKKRETFNQQIIGCI